MNFLLNSSNGVTSIKRDHTRADFVEVIQARSDTKSYIEE